MSIVVQQKQRRNQTKHVASAAAHIFYPIPACFRRARPAPDEPKDAPSTTSTSVYATDFGPCVLTWTRTLLGRTLRIQLQKVDYTIKIRSKPFLFWRNQGFKLFDGEVQVLWDFRRCRFGSETEPESGFCLGLAVGGELGFLIGDLVKPVYSMLRLGIEKKGTKQEGQRMVLRKEHVNGTRFFRAVAAVGGGRKVRILIEHFYSGKDSGMRFSFDGLCVLEIQHLVWKFRGSELVEYEGVSVNVSWDVYSWLFRSSTDANGMSGVFVFDFENLTLGLEERNNVRRSEMWSLSSIYSSGSSWRSSEDRETVVGFSLIVYATKS